YSVGGGAASLEGLVSSMKMVMKFVLAVAVWAGICAGEGATAEQDLAAIELSLGETLARVEAENLQVLLNREVVEQAMIRVARERSALFPQLSLDASQTRTKPVLIGQGLEDFVPPEMSPSNRFDARLTASVLLIDPMTIATYRSAKLGVAIS